MVTYRWGDESYEHRHVVDALGVTASYPGTSLTRSTVSDTLPPTSKGRWRRCCSTTRTTR
jgi:hypothetical protein